MAVTSATGVAVPHLPASSSIPSHQGRQTMQQMQQLRRDLSPEEGKKSPHPPFLPCSDACPLLFPLSPGHHCQCAWYFRGEGISYPTPAGLHGAAVTRDYSSGGTSEEHPRGLGRGIPLSAATNATVLD